MNETVKTRPSREYGVLQHSAILQTGREEEKGGEERRVTRLEYFIISLKYLLNINSDSNSIVLF